MKKLAAVLLLSVLSLSQSDGAEANWLTNFPAAQQKAKQEKKLVLMNFTGSDWCPWCIKLSKEVFSTPEFASYAEKNLVLVEVDFPVAKKLPPEQLAANEALQRKFGVERFPTLLVLNSESRRVAELSYMPGGPSAFIALFERIKAILKSSAQANSSVGVSSQ